MPGGVSSLHVVLHVYEAYSYATVSRVVDLPLEPSTRRLGHKRIDVGRVDFTGLTTDEVLALVGTHLLLPDVPPSGSRAQPPASPSGGSWGVQDTLPGID